MAFSIPHNSRYQNPDNDPRGPWLASDVTVPDVRTSFRYEWHGTLPPKGRSWRFDRHKAEELERDGRIYFQQKSLPVLKKYLSESKNTLQYLLNDLSGKQFEREIDITEKVVPQLASILGFSEDETFYDFAKGKYRADAVLSKSDDSASRVIIEIKRRRAPNVSDWVYQLRRYLEEFDCETGVLVSPDLVIVISGTEVRRFETRALSTDQTKEIINLLGRSQYGSDDHKEAPSGTLVKLIEAVESAKTTDEKGSSLERLSYYLLESVPSLTCKYRNLYTRSSEIDIVVEYNGLKGLIPLFEELGRYCLVECKNWSKPVGAGPVRDFIGKLEKCKARIGVIFSKNGVTGEGYGLDAIREIQSKYDRDGIFLLVISLEEIKDVKNGKDFIALLDRKSDNLRFDI